MRARTILPNIADTPPMPGAVPRPLLTSQRPATRAKNSRVVTRLGQDSLLVTMGSQLKVQARLTRPSLTHQQQPSPLRATHQQQPNPLRLTHQQQSNPLRLTHQQQSNPLRLTHQQQSNPLRETPTTQSPSVSAVLDLTPAPPPPPPLSC